MPNPPHILLSDCLHRGSLHEHQNFLLSIIKPLVVIGNILIQKNGCSNNEYFVLRCCGNHGIYFFCWSGLDLLSVDNLEIACRSE